MKQSTFEHLPENLPVPIDDGAADHIKGLSLPNIVLASSKGGKVDLGTLGRTYVIYCYPMTGRPNVPLPEGWDEIPGARGCTPQSLSFRAHYSEIRNLNADVFGLSTQDTNYQAEMAERLHLPFRILSDEQFQFCRSLRLPTFEVEGQTLVKRLTMIVHKTQIVSVHYPVFPSTSDPGWVIKELTKTRLNDHGGWFRNQAQGS